MKIPKLLSALLLSTLPFALNAQELTVSAAASLTNAFTEIGTKFQAGNPGATVRFNFAASGVLLQQINQGAPVDVFASADQVTMERGITQKLIDAASKKDFAANSLVLIEPAQDGPGLKTINDLTRPEVQRIAIGDAKTVPAGRYTKQVLDHAALWTTLEPKFAVAESVRQVLDYVSRGEAQAGFVYRTDAALMKEKVKIVMNTEGHTAVTYPVAIVADSKQKELATKFLGYLASPPAQEILARNGFTSP